MVVLRMLISLLLIAAIASPFAAGMIIEKRYNNVIAHLNAAYSGKIKFTGKFNKGYLKSTATTELNGGPDTDTITLEHTIQQGPVIFDFQGWGKPASYAPKAYGLGMIDTKFTGEIAKKISALYDGKEAYSIKTLVAFNGDLKTEFKNNPFTTNLGKGVLTWQGITGTATANKDLTMLSASMVMPLFEYRETLQPNETQLLHLGSIKVDFGNSPTSQDTFNIAIADVKLSNGVADQNGVAEQNSVSGLTFSTVKSGSGNLMNFMINVGFTSVQLHDHELGPFTLSLNAKNIDLQTLQAAMNTPMQQISQQTNPAMKIPSGMEPEKLLAFLKNKPTFDVTFKLTTKAGDLDITTHLEIGGANLTQVDAAAIAPTINATKKIQIGAKLFYKLLARYGIEQVHDKERMYFMTNKNSNIPNPYTMAADRLQVIVENWVNTLVTTLKAQNFITEQNDVITMDSTFANNELTINGVKKTKADLDNLTPLLQVPIPNAPAAMPNNAPPAKPATTAPATTAPVTPAPAMTAPAPTVPAPAVTPPKPITTKEPS